MTIYEIGKKDLTQLVGNRLTRNLGLDINEIVKIQIIKLDGQPKGPIFLHISTDDASFWIPGYLDATSNIFDNLLKIENLKYLLDLDNNYIRSTSEYDFVITEVNFLDLDVTNQHGSLNLKMGDDSLYGHIKIFLRLENSNKELIISKELANVGYFPEILQEVYFDDYLVIMITRELEDAKNLDDLIGKMYADTMYGKIDFDDFEKEIMVHYRAMGDTLTAFWGVLENRLAKKLITYLHDNPVELWVDKINKSMKIIFSEIEKQNKVLEKLSTEYLIEIEQKVIDWLENTDYRRIHGDCWLRQFTISQGQTYLIDFEDVLEGPIAYDVGGLLNSIAQQGFYFETQFPDRQSLPKSPRSLSSESINMLIDILKPTSISKTTWRLDISYGSILRGLHEIAYLLDHQPDLTWLIEFIISGIIKEFENLKWDKRFNDK